MALPERADSPILRAQSSYDIACAGPRASPVVGGHTPQHAVLQASLARLCGTQTAMLFPTGFAANLACLPALGGSPDVIIFSDALNHASIIDGTRLACRSGATVQVSPHASTVAPALLCSRAEMPLPCLCLPCMTLVPVAQHSPSNFKHPVLAFVLATARPCKVSKAHHARHFGLPS